MSLSEAIISANQTTRQRMQHLIAQLGDEQLGHALPDGRSIATILGHVAFWDQRVLSLVNKWSSTNTHPTPAYREPDEIDWLNDAVTVFQQAIPPRQLAALALQIAEEVDRAVATLSDDLITANEQAGEPVTLARAGHRAEHLDEIEQYLQSLMRD
jgi:hypothetical protein